MLTMMRSVSSSTLLSNAAALLVSLARDSDSDSLWLWSDIVDLVIGFVGWLVGWLGGKECHLGGSCAGQTVAFGWRTAPAACREARASARLPGPWGY